MRQILATVESENVDLIVMGKTHLKKRTERALMGHVTGQGPEERAVFGAHGPDLKRKRRIQRARSETKR